MSYFEDGGTVPIPFNIIPTPKSFLYLSRWIFKKFCSGTKFAKNEAIRTIRVSECWSERRMEASHVGGIRSATLASASSLLLMFFALSQEGIERGREREFAGF